MVCVCEQETQENTQIGRRNNAPNNNEGQVLREKGGHLRRDSFKPSFDTVSETYQYHDMGTNQGGDTTFSGPIPVSASSGFAWAAAAGTRRKDDVTSAVSDGSKSQFSALDPSFAKSTYGLPKQGSQELLRRMNSKHEMRKQQRTLSHQPESFDIADLYKSQDHTYQKDALTNNLVTRKNTHFSLLITLGISVFFFSTIIIDVIILYAHKILTFIIGL